MSRVAGIVLCGGHSRRMGRPKAWLPIGDETFLQRIVRVVAEAVGDVFVVAADGQELPPLPPHVRRVNDLWPDCGPLGGFATGLAAGTGYEAVFLTACDLPFLTAPFVRSVVEEVLGSDFDAVVPVTQDFQPLAAAYRTRVRPEVDRRLIAGEWRMMDFVGALRCQSYCVTSDQLKIVRNVNTPDEFAALSKP